MTNKVKKNKEYKRAHYIKNKDVYLIKAKERYYFNSDKIKRSTAEWRKKNPEKAREFHRNWKKKNPEKVLAYKLRSRFKITLEQYREMFKQQKNMCAICWINGEKFTRKLHIDHDHKTGKVRGLLCKNCNHGLGMFKDDIYRLSNAINYLKKNI